MNEYRTGSTDIHDPVTPLWMGPGMRYTAGMSVEGMAHVWNGGDDAGVRQLTIPERDWLRRECCKKNVFCGDIAAATGLSESTVRNMKARSGRSQEWAIKAVMDYVKTSGTLKPKGVRAHEARLRKEAKRATKKESTHKKEGT